MAVSLAPKASGCAAPSILFEGVRFISVRKMILADTKAGRKQRSKSVAIQRKDFEGLYRL